MFFLSEKKNTRLEKSLKRKGDIKYQSNMDFECNLLTSCKFIACNLITFKMINIPKLLYQITGLRKQEKKNLENSLGKKEGNIIAGIEPGTFGTKC